MSGSNMAFRSGLIEAVDLAAVPASSSDRTAEWHAGRRALLIVGQHLYPHKLPVDCCVHVQAVPRSKAGFEASRRKGDQHITCQLFSRVALNSELVHPA